MRLYILCCFLCISTLVCGQEIYSIKIGNTGAKIFSINPQNCEENIICDLPDYELYELTFHPSGNIFVIGFSKITKIYSLFEVDVNSCNVINNYTLPDYFNVFIRNFVGLCTGPDGHIYIGASFLTRFDYKTKEFIRLGDFNLPFRFVHDMSLIDGKIVMCVSQYIYPIEYSIEVNLEHIEASKISSTSICGVNTFYDCNSVNVFYLDQYGLNKINSADSTPILICPLTNYFDWKGLASKFEFIPAKRTLNLGNDLALCRSESLPISLPTLPGDRILWNDGSSLTTRTLSQAGTYTVTITTAEGCSITDDLTISRSYIKIPKAASISLCDGDTYTYKSKTYPAGAIITDSLLASTGCDTLLTLTLTRLAAPTRMRDTTTCDNRPILIAGTSYTVGDTITALLPSVTGCDTILYTRYLPRNPLISQLIITDTIVCTGATTTVSYPTSDRIRWSDGSTQPTAQLGVGTHQVAILEADGCTTTFEFRIRAATIDYDLTITDPTCQAADGSIAILNNDANRAFVATIRGQQTYTLTDLVAGEYAIVMTDPRGCSYTDTATLTSASTLDITIDTVLIADLGQLVALTYLNTGSGSIDTITFDPITDIRWVMDSILVQVNSNQFYTITFIDEQGCTVTRSLTVKANPKAASFVLPNVLSTSTINTENSLFYLKALGVTYDMAIYDRWGNLMHQSIAATGGDSTRAWSAIDSKVATGVYVYFLSIRTPQGIIQKVGSVTVL